MRSKTLASLTVVLAAKNRSLAIGWGRRFGTIFLILAATAMVSLSQNEQALHKMVTFTNLVGFDSQSLSPLVQGLDGNLYGTSLGGGTNGSGTLFKMTPGGTLTTIYNFCSQKNCTDGSGPTGALTLGTDGNFYGITGGEAFKITPGGTLTVLHNWCSLPNQADGCIGFEQVPYALVQATDGNFYGITDSGGVTGQGTFFKLTPSGTLTTLYTFCSQSGCTDGSTPVGLIQATDGNFYGTTYYGGVIGDGTVFKMTPTGTLTTLYSFCSQGGLSNCFDGAIPFGGVIQASDGNFYGTTNYGGANVNSASCQAKADGGLCGTIFKITPSGKLTTIYNFCSQTNCTDGAGPSMSLVQGTDGNFYGPTTFGGNISCSCGTLFQVTPDGKLTTLHSFDNPRANFGFSPANALFQATDGTFYGTTVEESLLPGFTGTAFSLSVGLGPFVEAVTTSGMVGQTVTILGTDLLGVTEVRFGGAEAQFKSISTTEIQTTIPSDAHTGFVTVHTLSGTLSSNMKFQVLP